MTQNPKLITEEEVAYHEAGHAVVAYRLGFRLETVSIVRDLETGGYCNQFMPTYLETNDGFVKNPVSPTDHVKKLLAVLAAGYISQGRQFPNNEDGLNTGSHIDFQSSQELCSDALNLDVHGADKDEFEKMVRSAYAMASVVLSHNWPAVKLVVKQLLKRKTLDGTQLEKILNNLPPEELPSSQLQP